MKADNCFAGILSQSNTAARHHSRVNGQNVSLNLSDITKFGNSSDFLNRHHHHQQQHRPHSSHRQRRNSFGLSDKESVCSASTVRSKRLRSRNISMKPLKSGGINKKSKTMDYTNYAYNEAVGRLKMMLATDSYTAPKTSTTSYLRSIQDDSGDNYSDNMSAIDRPVFADISKYLSPSQKSRLGGSAVAGYRSKKTFGEFSASKENLMASTYHHSVAQPLPTTVGSSSVAAIDYYNSPKPQVATATDSVQAPVEIFNFIEKQEDYIEQLEKESKYCRNELSNLLGKVKDVINENEQLTEHARHELSHYSKSTGDKCHAPTNCSNNIVTTTTTTTSPSSDSDEHLYGSKQSVAAEAAASRKKDQKSPRYIAAPNIVYEARISELEAELMQANIDLKRLKVENEDLKKKLSRSDPLSTITAGSTNCEQHRKQIEMLQNDKAALEESIKHLQKSLDQAKSDQYTNSSKRYVNDLLQMERSQAELEVKHLRDELDRQHERVRELQHEMARRLADERANAERRYNNQVDQLGGDLSSQWEQVAKLQLDLERQKRYESDIKRDLANRNAQIEELKMELRANRSTFLADMAQVNAEKQSLEQEITALRLQLDRANREGKTEAARLTAEINSLRQRQDRADADLLHSKREVLRLNDEIANLEKELAYGELKNEIRPTKKDLDKRISEMQEKHVETVNELEEMIQSQKQLMDKLTNECKTLTRKLEDTTMKHKTDISSLHTNVEYLTNRMLNSDQIGKLDTNTPSSYNSLPPATGKATLDYKPSSFGTTDNTRSIADDYANDFKTDPYNYDAILGKTTASDIIGSGLPPATTTTAGSYDTDYGGQSSNKYDLPTSIAGTYDTDYSKSNKYEPSNANGYDYTAGKSARTTGGAGGSATNDIDDENLKDNIGKGEKEQQQQQQLQQQQQRTNPIAENSNTNAGDYTNPTSSSGSNLQDPNMADYNTDYSAYEGYDPQQYDASAYDQTYDPSQYGTGDGSQYDTTGQGYGTAAGAYDYSATDYDTSGYQYDQGGTSAATTGYTPGSAAIPTTLQSSESGRTMPTPATSTAKAQPIQQPSTAAAAAVPAAATAPARPTTSTIESRNQPRTSTGPVGSSAATGGISSTKSPMPQQSSASASKK